MAARIIGHSLINYFVCTAWVGRLYNIKNQVIGEKCNYLVSLHRAKYGAKHELFFYITTKKKVSTNANVVHAKIDILIS